MGIPCLRRRRSKLRILVDGGREQTAGYFGSEKDESVGEKGEEGGKRGG